MWHWQLPILQCPVFPEMIRTAIKGQQEQQWWRWTPPTATYTGQTRAQSSQQQCIHRLSGIDTVSDSVSPGPKCWADVQVWQSQASHFVSIPFTHPSLAIHNGTFPHISSRAKESTPPPPPPPLLMALSFSSCASVEANVHQRTAAAAASRTELAIESDQTREKERKNAIAALFVDSHLYRLQQLLTECFGDRLFQLSESQTDWHSAWLAGWLAFSYYDYYCSSTATTNTKANGTQMKRATPLLSDSSSWPRGGGARSLHDGQFCLGLGKVAAAHTAAILSGWAERKRVREQW